MGQERKLGAWRGGHVGKERIVGLIHGPVGGKGVSWLTPRCLALVPLREWGPKE